MKDNTFQENVASHVEIHKTLHGTQGFSIDFVAKDLVQSFQYDFHEARAEIERYIRGPLKDYGVFIGRCQPFHLGHQAVVNEIMLSGRKPIMILGSINKHDEKNPLTFEERKALIQKVFCKEEVIVLGLPDNTSCDAWTDSLIDKLFQGDRTKDNVTIFMHKKPDDLKDFEYKGKIYKNEHWSKMLELEGIKIKNVDEKQCSLGLTIHASDIRKSEEIAKRNLDARVYWLLKNKGWYI